VPALYETDNPELDTLDISVTAPPPGQPLGPVTTTVFSHFLSYSYRQHFLTPADCWHFDIDADELTDTQLNALLPGGVVEIRISGNRQTTGYIDDVRFHGNRGEGNIVTVTGRDWMSPAVDCHVDPQIRFAPSMTLSDLVNAVFAFLGNVQFATDSIANLNVITGGAYGKKTSKKGKSLKSHVLHQIKPYDQEGCYAFATRVSQRFGLWIWAAQDKQTIVCDTPDFSSAPLYQLLQSTDPSLSPHNNVLEHDTMASRKDQPTALFASGFGGGGEYAKATLKGGILNPVTSILLSLQSQIAALPGPSTQQSGQVQGIQAAYPTVDFEQLATPPSGSGIAVLPLFDPVPRPLYLKDRDAHNQDELNAFLLRELSLRTRSSLVAKYAIAGHRLGGVPIGVNTMVDVQDDKGRIHQPLWIIGREFHKDRNSGTRTHLELIRPGSLVFAPSGT
jgi:hypothetical protein